MRIHERVKKTVLPVRSRKLLLRTDGKILGDKLMYSVLSLGSYRPLSYQPL